MITFSNTIKLVILVWLMNILSAGYSKAENSTLDCMITPKKNVQGIDPRKIAGVNKCAKGYENKDIIDRCENLINRNEPAETKLYDIVINNDKNVAYWNIYCATCNNATETETSFQAGPSWKAYFKNNAGDDPCAELGRRIQRSEVDDLHNLTQILISEGLKLEAGLADNTQLECSMDGKWPVQLINRVIFCLLPEFNTGQATRLKQCQYTEETGRICANMRLHFDGLVFYFNNGKKIDYNVTLPEYKFNPGQYYLESEYPGIFYICEQPATIYGGKHSVKISMVVISLIFIIINLGINSNKRYLQQNNTNKLLYLYMIGLVPITIILLIIYLSHPVPCVAFYLAQFLWVYHFFWSMLIFMEFCLLAFCTLHNRIVSDIPTLGYRYLIYGMLGFVIPFTIPIIYYFGVLVLNENYKEDLSQPDSLPYILQYSCPKIPNHLGVSCISYGNFGSPFYEGWVGTFLKPSFGFFIPALFLATSAVILYYFLNYRSAGIRSIPYGDHLFVLTKMASIMGIHWVLFKIYQSYGSDYEVRILGVSLDTLCQLSIDFHGIIVFIVFGAETCVGFIMNMCGCEYKSVSQQDGNDDMEIS